MDLARLNIIVQATGAVKEADRLTNRLNRTGDAADRASRRGVSGFEKFRRSIFNVRTVLGTLGLGLFAKGILDATLALERAQVGLETVTGSARQAGIELAFVRQQADELGLQYNTLQQQYISLSAATKGTKLEGEETRRLFLAMSKAGTALKLSNEQIQGSFTALEQIMSRGKLSAEEIRRQLGNRLPGAFQLAAKSIGVTTAELDQMLQTGSIMSDEFLPAFARALEDAYSEGAQKGMTSLQADINRAKNAWQQFLEALGGSGLITVFRRVITAATPVFKWFNDSFADIEFVGGQALAGVEHAARLTGAGIRGAFDLVFSLVKVGFRALARFAIDQVQSITAPLEKSSRFLANLFGADAQSIAGLTTLNRELDQIRIKMSSQATVASEISRVTGETVGAVEAELARHKGVTAELEKQHALITETKHRELIEGAGLNPLGDGGKIEFGGSDDLGEIASNAARVRREFEGVAGGIAKAQQALGSFGERVADTVASISFAIEDRLTDGLAGWIEGTKSAKQAFSEMARGIISDLIKIMIRQLIVRSLMQAIGGAIGGSYTPNASGAGATDAFGRTYEGPQTAAGGFAGGSPGMTTNRRADFRNAPRFNGGGVVADEVPIVAHRGETVFTPEQMSALGQAIAGAGGGNRRTPVEVVNVFDPQEVDQRIANNPDLVLNVISRNARKVRQMVGAS